MCKYVPFCHDMDFTMGRGDLELLVQEGKLEL
jgi:hypothetical protein